MHTKTTFKGNFFNKQKIGSFKETSYKNDKLIKSKLSNTKKNMKKESKILITDRIIPFIPSMCAIVACTSFNQKEYEVWNPPSFMDVTTPKNYDLMAGAIFAQAYSVTTTNLLLA